MYMPIARCTCGWTGVATDEQKIHTCERCRLVFDLVGVKVEKYQNWNSDFYILREKDVKS